MFKFFRKTIAPPPDPILPVLAFIGDFERGKFSRALGFHKRNGQMMPEVIALREALINSGLVYGREWVDYMPTYTQKLQDPENIAQLNAADLQTVVTGLLRLDRLGEGFVISSMCQNGITLAILRRLQTLHDQGEIAPLIRQP